MAQSSYNLELFNTLSKKYPLIKKLRKKGKTKLGQNSSPLNLLDSPVSSSNIIRHRANVEPAINIYTAPVMPPSYY